MRRISKERGDEILRCAVERHCVAFFVEVQGASAAAGDDADGLDVDGGGAKCAAAGGGSGEVTNGVWRARELNLCGESKECPRRGSRGLVFFQGMSRSALRGRFLEESPMRSW